MKIFLYKWINCISALEVVIVNANTKKEADKKFDKWCEMNAEKAPTTYSPREFTLQDNEVLYLEKWNESKIKLYEN
jgi:hypothetical protein